MRINEMLKTSIFLLYVYNRYAYKLYKKISDNYLKTLLLVSYKDHDLKKIIEEIKKYKEEFRNAIKNGNLNKAYKIFKTIEKKYTEFENKSLERIENLVRIRALDIAKKNIY